jgi:hypothetical protein
MGKLRDAYEILVGKSEQKRPLRKPRHRWEVNVRMDLREIVHLAQNRGQWWGLVKMVMKLQVP